MRIAACIFFYFFLQFPASASADQGPLIVKVDSLVPTRQVPAHDPVLIKQQDTYFLFATGNGISVWSSKDLRSWQREKPVFDKAPQWAVDTIPGFKNHIWAPDISFHNGLYHLYYSVSVFGKNRSAIGVATNKTLDHNSVDFRWIDHGPVIQSYPGKTNWNAIDPNLVLDDKKNPFLVFGSFWDGLKMVKLQPDLLHTAGSLVELPTIARREGKSNPIEAPFIFKKGEYYYLFASIDYCCKGVNSTYKLIVGRSKNIKGPYLDKAGKALNEGGGTILLQANEDWFGVGHNGICAVDGKVYLVCHGYDARDKGKAKLILKQLDWDKAHWPVLGEEPGRQ